MNQATQVVARHPTATLGVPEHLAPVLASASNHGLAASSFIGWLVEKRGVKAKTVQIYLSGLRMAHFKRGLFNVNLEKKRLVWAVVTMAFNGSFRVHELLSRDPHKFDPSSTLKSPKERRLKMGVAVDVFPTASYLCPVAAYGKYLLSLDRSLPQDGPAFLTSRRTGYTGTSFNHDLHYVKCARLKRMKVARELASSLRHCTVVQGIGIGAAAGTHLDRWDQAKSSRPMFPGQVRRAGCLGRRWLG